jgi:6,7-dimethyl-8-ribityllumazine synthase
MNQMLQDAPQDTSEAKDTSEVKGSPETVDRPPVVAHPRFAKPQRVAFVQSSWHREVVEECRIAFLAEIEARHITNVDVFEVPGSFEIPLHAQILAKSSSPTP